jgi:NADH-quinone oxidoreductase subunit H
MFNFFNKEIFFFNDFLYYFLYYSLSSIFFLIFILISIALFTVMERKIMAALQKRKGPNVHGI